MRKYLFASALLLFSASSQASQLQPNVINVQVEFAGECNLTYDQAVVIANKFTVVFAQMKGISALSFGGLNGIPGCSFEAQFDNKPNLDATKKVFNQGLLLDGFPVTFLGP